MPSIVPTGVKNLFPHACQNLFISNWEPHAGASFNRGQNLLSMTPAIAAAQEENQAGGPAHLFSSAPVLVEWIC